MMNIGFLTLDIIIIIAIIAVLFFLSFYFGKKFLAKLIILFYPTLLIFLNLPYFKPEGDTATIGTFIGLYIVMFLIVRRNATAKKLYSGFRKFTDGLVLSIMFVVQLLTLYYHILPLESLYRITLPFSNFFTETLPLGALLIIPLVGLFVTNISDE